MKIFATRFWRIASGEDGIRTHAPFRTNGFQDRLVMTTSIPLQVCCGLLFQPNASVILAKMYTSVNMFFQTFFFFFFYFFFTSSQSIYFTGFLQIFILKFLDKTFQIHFKKLLNIKILQIYFC